MLPNLKSLAVFAKVAETGSFSAAATSLGISAPVVSQHISQLEQTLDTALVYRSTRSMTLTHAGKQLSVHAHNMLDAAETGIEQLQNTIKSPSGHLTIAVPSFAAAPGFIKIFANFSDQYPDIELRVSFSPDRHNLNESGYDLAIQLGNLTDSNLMARKLTHGHGSIFGTPELMQRLGEINQPSDLFEKNCPFICELGWSEMMLHKVGSSKEVYTGVVKYAKYHVDNGEAKKQLALLHKGLIMIPSFYVKNELLDGKFVHVLPDWTSQPVDVFAVWPRNAGSRSLTRLFLNFLTNAINEEIKNLPCC